jgi:hypothetical protein
LAALSDETLEARVRSAEITAQTHIAESRVFVSGTKKYIMQVFPSPSSILIKVGTLEPLKKIAELGMTREKPSDILLVEHTQYNTILEECLELAYHEYDQIRSGVLECKRRLDICPPSVLGSVIQFALLLPHNIQRILTREVTPMNVHKSLVCMLQQQIVSSAVMKEFVAKGLYLMKQGVEDENLRQSIDLNHDIVRKYERLVQVTYNTMNYNKQFMQIMHR